MVQMCNRPHVYEPIYLRKQQQPKTVERILSTTQNGGIAFYVRAPFRTLAAVNEQSTRTEECNYIKQFTKCFKQCVSEQGSRGLTFKLVAQLLSVSVLGQAHIITSNVPDMNSQTLPQPKSVIAILFNNFSKCLQTKGTSVCHPFTGLLLQ